ncbi:uncharacterized protein LOC126737239 isoform X2 [Anthonomus grandis grandis]|nr:uncharacterized protein LOC126737239 isoform X2 [Anthonomus grandis grandis]
MEKEPTEEAPTLQLNRNGMNVDIFSMLSKAQENFNKTPSKPEGNQSTFMASTPRIPDMASQSVMDFFAKAGTKKPNQKPVASGENVLHRLMSNPAHSVEHIEKQQRSITPQEIFNHTIDQGTLGDRRSVPINFSSGAIKKFNEGLEPQLNGLSISNISPPKQNVASSPPLTYVSQNQSSSVPTDDTSDLMGTSPFQKFLQNAQKPLLMTPMMFTAPNPIKESSEGSPDESGEPVEMLTEKQLAQALIYLLKNNSDFIKQIHQAYTNSILEKVNKTKNL